MTDIKISQFVSYTTPDAVNDVIPIVDVANQATKKITRNNFLGITSAPVGINDTQTLTGKTFDTAGTGNVFKINSTQITDKTGTGKAVLDTSPTIVTPTIASFANATHNHQSSAGGGQLTASSALVAATVTAAVMKFGMVRQRQGGTAGDATWGNPGTTNVDTSAKDVFIQAGSVTTSAVADTTVTFPVAFNQVPLVFAMSQTASGASTFVMATSVSTTQVVLRTYTGSARDGETCAWLAVGQ